MKTVFHGLRPVFTLAAAALVAVCALLFVGPQAAQPVDALCRPIRSFTPSDTLLQPDGRINQVAHFGGDSLYCVDANGNPTNEFETVAAFRLLNLGGQTLWELPFADVTASLTALEASGEDQVIGSGDGSFGTATLSLLANEGTLSFQFAAYDEYGKLNTMEFQGCHPVGPSAPGTTSGGDDESAPAPVCYVYVGCGEYSETPIVCELSKDPCGLDVNDDNNNGDTTDYICGTS